MTRDIPWTRILAEALLIVVSILLAFGIDAWWDERQAGARRELLLEDLGGELVRNRDRLENALVRQRDRVVRIQLILDEASPSAARLSGDSVRALQRSVAANPIYAPAFGILNLWIQSGDLALLEDRELRDRLAGLDAVSTAYLNNQSYLTEVRTHPEILFGTGSIVVDYSSVSTGDEVLTNSTPEVRILATKYLEFVRRITDQGIVPLGEVLLAEFDSILALMERRASAFQRQ